MEALRQKVERLERGGREKNARIAELERRCDELRESESQMAMEGSPNLFQKVILSSSLCGREREALVLGSGLGGVEGTPVSRTPGLSPSSPGWLPSTRKAFEAYLERTVLGQLSTFMDKWMTEDWEPRALRILKRLESATARGTPTPTPTPAEQDAAGFPGTVQDAEPGTPAGPDGGEGGGAEGGEAESGTLVESDEADLAMREVPKKPGMGKRKRGKEGAPTSSPEKENKRPPQTQPEAP